MDEKYEELVRWYRLDHGCFEAKRMARKEIIGDILAQLAAVSDEYQTLTTEHLNQIVKVLRLMNMED